jgi:predicted phage terminase large subunit-like protein
MVSHKIDLPIQNAGKLRRLISSEWYQARWPIEFRDDQNAKTKFENTKTGFVGAVSAGSITGQRGDRIILDDAMSWSDANSEQTRNTTIEWFLGALPTRLNSPVRSSIIVIEQRLHEEDISGTILDRQLGYDHIRLPMEYDESFPMPPTLLGVSDPRSEEGELLFPERFPQHTVDREKHLMSPYELAGQFQQVPIPKGGGIIQRDWWMPWEDENYPELDYILASLDTAYGEKQENDFSAMTVWGVFTVDSKAFNSPTRTLTRYGTEQQIERVYAEGAPHVIMLYAWRARVPFFELVKRTLETCRKYKIDRLLVEGKAAGKSVLQELRRVHASEEFGITEFDPGRSDKWQRLNSVSHLWQEGMIHAPDKEWAEMVIREVEVFPKGKHDDLTDTVSQAAKYMRDNGLLTRAPERLQQIEDSKVYLGSRANRPLYPA